MTAALSGRKFLHSPTPKAAGDLVNFLSMYVQRQKMIRFATFAVLLFCLCCSRGEGVHLFPFVDNGTAADAAESGPGSSHYETSSNPKGTPTKQSNKKRESAPPAISIGSPVVERQPDVSFHVTAADSVQPSKFDRTSSSDRSPPIRS